VTLARSAIFGKLSERGREGTLLRVIGLTLMGIGLAMLVPLAAALLFDESIIPFASVAVCCIIASIPMMLLFRSGKDMRPVDGLLLIFIVWGIVMLISAFPFMQSGMSPMDAFFESVSGFTTTGSTVMGSVEAYPKSLLLWRSLTQWIGGMAIILIFISVFPILGLGGRTIFRNEMSGSGTSNFTAKMKDAAVEFCIVYGVLSAIFFVICTIMSEDPFDSLCLTFTTISTGGFMSHDGGAGVYSPYVQILIIVFMFLGGTNFYLHYQRIYRKNDAGYLKNSEFRSMLILYAVAAVVLFGLTYGLFKGTGVLTYAKDVVFTVVSMGTSTGFTVTDVNAWTAAPAAVAILFVVILIGGSSGSTSGGIKIGRAVILLKTVMVDLKKRVHPRAVLDVRMGSETLDKETVSATSVLIFLFAVTIAGGAFALMLLESIGLADSFMLSLTTVANCGFAGPYGPADLATLSAGGKGVMTMLMWIGRLEIGTALVLFTPFFWKEIIRSRRRVKHTENE